MMIQAGAQIPLDLGHRVAFGREDFMVAPCNRNAVDWIDRWPGWPAPVLVLYGPAGSGKSHLGAVWTERSGAAWVDAALLGRSSGQEMAAMGTHLVLDHPDIWIGDRAVETELFHLYNIMRERGGSILATMRLSPAQMDFSLPDLASRLRAAPAVGIDPPDETVLAAIMVKLFADRQIDVGVDVLSYVLPRMERSFAAAHALVDAADRLALAEKRAVTLPLMRRVLSGQ